MCCWVILVIGSYQNHSWVADFQIVYHNNQQSTICIVHYFLPHLWQEIMVYPSNVGHDHIFQMLKLQTKAALKEHNTNDSSFRYLLEWNDWSPKHIKVSIQHSCTNIVLFSIWYPRFQREVALDHRSWSLVGNQYISVLSTQTLVFKKIQKNWIIFKMALETSQNITNGSEWNKSKINFDKKNIFFSSSIYKPPSYRFLRLYKTISQIFKKNIATLVPMWQISTFG
jgi:hypothetical protein